MSGFAPDLVYVHNATAFQPQLFQVCGRYGLPMVLHLHDYGYLCPRMSMFRSGRNCSSQCPECRLLTGAWRRHSAMVGDVIAVSSFVKTRYRDAGAFPGAEWHVLPNVDQADHKSTEKQKKRTSGTLTFAYLGALTPEKGIADLVRAFLLLDDDQIRLLIAGTGPASFVSELKRKTRGRPVEWLGQVDRKTVYDQADIVDCAVPLA